MDTSGGAPTFIDRCQRRTWSAKRSDVTSAGYPDRYGSSRYDERLPVPCEHLFHPGAVDLAGIIVARGWPTSWLVGCALCGASVDLVGELRESGVRGLPRGRAL